MSQAIRSDSVAPLQRADHPQPVPAVGWTAGVARLGSRALPQILVLLALGGLAYWGHETEWRLPRFASLAGGASADDDDWCAEHGVPESICVECNPKLMPRPVSYGWCKVHGVHECPLEHPEVSQLNHLPTITPGDLVRAQQAMAFAIRPANSSKCKMHLRRVQFASDEAVARAGVEVSAAWVQPVVEAVTAPGEINYDPTRVASLAPPVAGRVSKVLADVGQHVKKGDVLALVDAVEVGRAKAELLKAIALLDMRSKTLARLDQLVRTGGISEAQYARAEADAGEARLLVVSAQQALINLGLPVAVDTLKGLAPEELSRRIQFLGLPETIARSLDPQTTTANLVPVTAPLDGTVVSRKAVAGEQADPAHSLFVVADVQQVWLTLQVRQEDAKLLHARDARTGAFGQTVRFLPGGSDREIVAEVTWIGTAIDEKTRTVPVRAVVANADRHLRAGAFGTGRIILREEANAVVVPSEAVQWEGDCHVVFVRDKDYEKRGAFKVFHTRTVRPGALEGGLVEIIAGVLPGEVIVTRGSGVLRSELLKNNLGEG
jgi:cobalt-zinc-cadmium efflux system membrane fusion protein